MNTNQSDPTVAPTKDSPNKDDCNESTTATIGTPYEPNNYSTLEEDVRSEGESDDGGDRYFGPKNAQPELIDTIQESNVDFFKTVTPTNPPSSAQQHGVGLGASSEIIRQRQAYSKRPRPLKDSVYTNVAVELFPKEGTDSDEVIDDHQEVSTSTKDKSV